MGRDIAADIYPVHINEFVCSSYLFHLKGKQLLHNLWHVPIAINGHVKANTVAYQQVRPSDCLTL